MSTTSSPSVTAQPVTYLGYYYVYSGPSTNPPPATASCVQRCATLYPGYANYGCSLSSASMTHQAYYSCAGLSGCQTQTDTFSNGPAYGGCTCSAYVYDVCFSANYCWAIGALVSTSPSATTSVSPSNTPTISTTASNTPTISTTASNTPTISITPSTSGGPWMLLGSYNVNAGAAWSSSPATVTCAQECAAQFPGSAIYACSQTSASVSHNAYYSCYAQGCQTKTDTFSNGAAYTTTGICSAYVNDGGNCASTVNYCWGTVPSPSATPTISVSASPTPSLGASPSDTATISVTASPSTVPPVLLGSYNVNSGPAWSGSPSTVTCVQECAIQFPGRTNYGCSQTSASLTHNAYYSCYAQGCLTKTDTFSNGAAYTTTGICSAYVNDGGNCASTVNYCWGTPPTPSTTPTISVTATVTPTISTTISITPTISVTPSVSPTISITASPSSAPPVLLGSYNVNSGPAWSGSPATVTCAQECAALYPGRTNYGCSQTTASLTHNAYYSCYAQGCLTKTDTFSNGAAYTTTGICSAYVNDGANCLSTVNYCWGVPPSPSNTATVTASASVSATISLTASNTPTISITGSTTPVVSPTISNTASASVTRSSTTSSSTSPSRTATFSVSPTSSVSASLTPSSSSTISITASNSVSASLSGSISVTPVPSGTCGVTYLGYYQVSAGPSYVSTPATVTCAQECANLYPGYQQYGCSTCSSSMSHSAYYSCSGTSGCVTQSDTFSNGATFTSSACSAYVSYTCSLYNYCWATGCKASSSTSLSASTSPTASATISLTASVTPSLSQTASNTGSGSNTPTNTGSGSNTPSNTRAASSTPSNTPSASNTASNSQPASATPTNTPPVSGTPSNTPSASNTPSTTPTISVTSTVSVTPVPSGTCGVSYLGAYNVGSGPGYGSAPATVTCAQRCASLYPGYQTYGCSTSGASMTHTAFYSCYGVGGCQSYADTFSNGATYQSGTCSSYVSDNCGSSNYCWAIGCQVSVSTTPTISSTHLLTTGTPSQSASSTPTPSRLSASSTPAPAGLSCATAYSVTLNAPSGVATSSAVASNPGLAAGQCGTAHGLWFSYHHTSTEVSQVTASTCSSLTTSDTFIAVYEGQPCAGLGPCDAANDNAGGSCGTASQVSFVVTTGQFYYIYVSLSSNAPASATLGFQLAVTGSSTAAGTVARASTPAPAINPAYIIAPVIVVLAAVAGGLSFYMYRRWKLRRKATVEYQQDPADYAQNGAPPVIQANANAEQLYL